MRSNKGLKALKRIRQETCPVTYMPDFDKEECCKIIEKELKTLEIIKEHKNKGHLFWIMEEYPTWEDYLEHCKKSDLNPYIQNEEYDLLKEVLC